jgi:hypothetical protein
MEMYTNEGLRRIHLLGKRIMLFGTVAVIALWLLGYVVNRGGSLLELLMLATLTLLCGAILWIIAWIVEGFLTSSGRK